MPPASPHETTPRPRRSRRRRARRPGTRVTVTPRAAGQTAHFATHRVPAAADAANGRDPNRATAMRRVGAVPAGEEATDPGGVEVERVADVLERERPGDVGRSEPVGGLVEQPRGAATWDAGVLAERPQRVLQDGAHEAQLGQQLVATPQELGVLYGQDLLGIPLRGTAGVEVPLEDGVRHADHRKQPRCHARAAVFLPACVPRAPLTTRRRHACRRYGRRGGARPRHQVPSMRLASVTSPPSSPEPEGLDAAAARA